MDYELPNSNQTIYPNGTSNPQPPYAPPQAPYTPPQAPYTPPQAPYTPPQPSYTPPTQQPLYAPPQKDNTGVVSIRDWVVTFVLLGLPVPFLRLILLIVWLTSPDTNRSKKNWIIAGFVYSAILVGVVIVLFILMVILGLLFSGDAFDIIEDIADEIFYMF